MATLKELSILKTGLTESAPGTPQWWMTVDQIIEELLDAEIERAEKREYPLSYEPR